MKPLEEDMSQELSWWIWNQEPWTQLELDHTDNCSDLITSSSDNQELVTTGPRDTTLKVLNWLTLSWIWSERKLKDVIAYKVSRSSTLWEEVLDLVWELFWSPRSRKNTLIEWWKLSPLSHLQKCLTPSLNHTTALFLFTSWSKTPMKLWSLIMKLCMISVSELWNWPPQPMVTWTIWSPLLWVVSLAAWDSQVNWTVTWENWLSTWFHSQDSISSWLVSPHWPPEDPNSTEPWLYQNWLNRCSMPRTWCVLLTQDTEDTWLPPLCSEEEWVLKKSMNRCWTSRTRTPHTSLSGSQITWRAPFVISHQRDWRWPSPSSVTPPPSKKCSRESLNNSLVCSEERPSCTGTLVKEWTKWNSLKPNPTWMTWSLNTSSIRMPLPKKKENSMKKNKPMHDLYIF